MAFVLPIISAISTVAAAGSVAAAVGTLGGFLSVAGGVLTGIGVLTGEKDLLKLGGVMSLGSGLANLAGGAAEAGAEASSSWDAADSAAGSDAAQFAKHASPDGASLTSATEGSTLGNIGAPSMPQVQIDELGATQGGGSLMQRAADMRSGGLNAGTDAVTEMAARPLAKMDPVTSAGQSMDSSTMQSILDSAWQKTKALGSGVGDFVKNNKELVAIGGSVLNSMYGPEAEQLDWQKGILARRLRNLNSQVRLGRIGTTPNPAPIAGG